MKYIINPYSQIIINNEKYEFYAPPKKSITTKTEIDVSEDTVLDMLLSPEGLSKEELVNIVGTEKADFLIKHEIYLNALPDDNMVSSRTKQFFNQYLSAEQEKRIRESNLLILGCGGIGSSIAWVFAGLGIKRMTIVDYDVVEISNLNRMFMFDKTDIGKKKVDVIKDKLQKLYSDMEIEVVKRRITSEAVLSEICLSQEYTLIIKALDSPSSFPVWLDSVCKKNRLKYVSGITLRDRIIVGPTYIPDIAEDGWSDIIQMDTSSERIYGKVPSIGSMLFNVTDRVAIEAIKILIGDYNACEYKNCIFSENIFTGEKEVMRSKYSRFKDDGNRKANTLLNILVIVAFGLCMLYNSKFIPLVFILVCCLPFCSYYGRKYILLQTFINSTIYALFLTLYVLNNIGFNMLSFCFILIVSASILSMVSLIINSLIMKSAKRIFINF